jgi:serine/threonine protein kinase
LRHKEFAACSPEVIDLIKKLLVVDPNERLSAKEALQHPWFKLFDQNNGGDSTKIDPVVLQILKEFKGTSKLKKAALKMLVKMVDFKEIEKLKIEF